MRHSLGSVAFHCAMIAVIIQQLWSDRRTTEERQGAPQLVATVCANLKFERPAVPRPSGCHWQRGTVAPAPMTGAPMRAAGTVDATSPSRRPVTVPAAAEGPAGVHASAPSASRE
jgi:hypothetical protein